MANKDIVLSVRLDKKLLDELDFFTGKKNNTRTEHIRLAIQGYVDGLKEAETDMMTEDYINARIGEKEYLKYFGFSKVPGDVLVLRKERLARFKSNEG